MKAAAAGLACVAVALVVPTGHHEPYPRQHLAQHGYAEVCRALTSQAVGDVVGRRVAARSAIANVANAEVGNLFPAISRTACIYRWHDACANPGSLRRAALYVTTMPSGGQALGRYTYARALITEDSVSAHNNFKAFSLDGLSGYEFTLGPLALTRLLQGRFVLDLHTEGCGLAGRALYGTDLKLIHSLQLPVRVSPLMP